VVAASGPVNYFELGRSKRILSFFFYLLAKGSHQIFPMIQGGNFILKKSALQQAGGFNTKLDFYGEDTDTAIRLSEIGKIKFDLNMWVYSSARRVKNDGLFILGSRYVLNYFWIWVAGKPWTTDYHDIRPD
jgi:GT2 family glycosyltransferase